MGVVGRGLIEEGIVVIRQGAVHLVRGYMEEFLALPEASVRQLPGRLRAVEHHGGAQDVSLDEHLRIPDASVHMALRREMNHPIDLVLGEYP